MHVLTLIYLYIVYSVSMLTARSEDGVGQTLIINRTKKSEIVYVVMFL